MYDPLFSQLEIAVLSALGVVVLRENEVRGKAGGLSVPCGPVWSCRRKPEGGSSVCAILVRPVCANCDQGGGVAAGGEEGAASAPLTGGPSAGAALSPGWRLQPSPGWVVAESSDGGSLRPWERRLSIGGDWTPR